MRFTWDPNKSTANRVNRGFDFEYAALIFGGRTVEWADDRHDYRELRFLAVGLAEGLMLTVCFTDRLDDKREVERRIISARRSNRRERKSYTDGGEDG